MKPATKATRGPPFNFDPDNEGVGQGTLEARVCGLDQLTRQITARRNVIEVKNKALRVRIEADMRGNLDRADAYGSEARTALLAGDVTRYESKLKDARIELLIALNKLKNPFARRAEKRNALNVNVSKMGGKATAKKFARPDLDDLILGCLQRGEKTRQYTKEWASHFNVSADAIERHIRLVKARLAKS